MDFIIQWVTQIVIFILLATIIDLLIPANSMKKYINFVVGLILILIFLKPFFTLFNIDLQHAFDATLTEIFQDEYDEENIENLIENQKSEIESSQNAYILEQMAVQFIEIANTPLQEEYQVVIQEMDFLFEEESSYTFENLEEVIVYIHESDKGEGTVHAVDDVVINTGDPPSNKHEVDAEGIKRLLHEVWELDDIRLSLRWEGGAS